MATDYSKVTVFQTDCVLQKKRVKEDRMVLKSVLVR